MIPSILKKGEIKLPQLNKDVSAVDKMSIYMQTGKKIFRGLLKKPFLKKASGILFVGKGTSITHRSSILFLGE